MSTTIDVRVAVCICTYNRPQSLTRLLVSLQNIELTGLNPSSVEIIVVDNDPNPETAAICQRSAVRLPVPIHYVDEPIPGITHARNRAVNVALMRGADFLAFIDDDDEPQSDWLIRLLDRQAVTHADLVFGTWLLDPDRPQWARDTGIFRSPQKVKNESKGGRYGLPGCASTCNVLVSRDILETAAAVGPVFAHAFKSSGGEDKDFFIRAHKFGARLASADTSVIHRKHEPARYTARGLFKRGFKNGCSQMNMARYHGDTRRSVKLLAIAVAKLFIALFSLPFSIFSKGQLMHSLYRVAKSLGALYSAMTGRNINYYSH